VSRAGQGDRQAECFHFAFSASIPFPPEFVAQIQQVHNDLLHAIVRAHGPDLRHEPPCLVGLRFGFPSHVEVMEEER